jgi:hypothetical protein
MPGTRIISFARTRNHIKRKSQVKRREKIVILKPMGKMCKCQDMIEIIELKTYEERKDFIEKIRQSKALISIGAFQKAWIVQVRNIEKEALLKQKLTEEGLKYNKNKGLIFIIPEMNDGDVASIQKLIDIIERDKFLDRSLSFFAKY